MVYMRKHKPYMEFVENGRGARELSSATTLETTLPVVRAAYLVARLVLSLCLSVSLCVRASILASSPFPF